MIPDTVDHPLAERIADGRARACIENVTPQVDGGRFAVKRIAGDTVVVEADVFADGHDHVAAIVRWRARGHDDWIEVPMSPEGNDRFSASFVLPRPGLFELTIEGWIDRFGTWRADLAARVAAGQNVDIDLKIGAALVRDTARRATGHVRVRLEELADLLAQGNGMERRIVAGRSAELAMLMSEHDPRPFSTTLARPLPIVVDRDRARFSTWYELFPRSCGAPGQHGTLRDVIARLPDIAEMGFDVLYLPPIHPIGTTARKGRNNTTSAGPGDVGSPWAIGSDAGGHTDIHPALGTLADFEALRSAAAQQGIELALDIAFQASPDHPWVREHPRWFRHRPDGTIQPAENPPKIYQDIYPLDFESDDWRGLWEALASVIEVWIERGVEIFRVDNPHTKSLRFWEWCLSRIKARHPGVVFLAEAFTRPRRMGRLAKAGFSQSYTYFTWRNTSWELRRYFEELTQSPVREFFRPNLWPNTPDILPEYLQYGGRPAFVIRLVLAATLGASYGIYGPAFEVGERRAVREGSEEYLDSEKYQIRDWDLGAGREMSELVAHINRIRRDNPALQQDHDLRFYDCDNDQLLCFAKNAPPHHNTVVVIVNLDPHHVQSGWVHVPLHDFGAVLGPLQMHDLLSEDRFVWTGDTHFVQLDPRSMPAHLFRVRRRIKSERDFDYFG